MERAIKFALVESYIIHAIHLITQSINSLPMAFSYSITPSSLPTYRHHWTM